MIIFPPHHYLSPNPGRPVITADAIDKDTIFCTPLTAALMPVHNGSDFEMRQDGQLPLVLNSGHLAGVIYSVFSFDVSGVTKVGASPAWANSGFGTAARGTGGTYPETVRDATTWLDVNANAITVTNDGNTWSLVAGRGVYMGDFCPSSNGHVTCHVGIRKEAKWGIFNAHNKQPLQLRSTYPAHDWIVGRGIFSPPNSQPTPANTNPPIPYTSWAHPTTEDWTTGTTAILGQKGCFKSEYSQILYASAEGFPTANCTVDTGIRINSEAYGSGNPAYRGQVTASNNINDATITAKVRLDDYIGPVKATPGAWIESGPSGSVAQFWGSEESMVLTLDWQG
jgi:hypothetical protein